MDEGQELNNGYRSIKFHILTCKQPPTHMSAYIRYEPWCERADDENIFPGIEGDAFWTFILQFLFLILAKIPNKGSSYGMKHLYEF